MADARNQTDDDEIKHMKAMLARAEKEARAVNMKAKANSLMARGKVSEAAALVNMANSLLESSAAEAVKEFDITPKAKSENMKHRSRKDRK